MRGCEPFLPLNLPRLLQSQWKYKLALRDYPDRDSNVNLSCGEAMYVRTDEEARNTGFHRISHLMFEAAGYCVHDFGSCSPRAQIRRSKYLKARLDKCLPGTYASVISSVALIFVRYLALECVDDERGEVASVT